MGNTNIRPHLIALFGSDDRKRLMRLWALEYYRATITRLKGIGLNKIQRRIAIFMVREEQKHRMLYGTGEGVPRGALPWDDGLSLTGKAA